MAVSIDDIKKLRAQTGVGFTDCKKALEESGGDMEKAVEYLRKKGIATAAKRSGRDSTEGTIGVYVHNDAIGVLVELNCETDFVARNDDFKALAKDIAMHVAATNPLYVRSNEVPTEVVEKEKEIYREELDLGKKPEDVQEKILEGRLGKYYEEVCLMDQIYVKDQKKHIRDLISEAVAAMGEKIEIGKIARVAVGE